jgi:hypothetical protein
MDQPDLALVLNVHVFGSVIERHETRPFQLIPMNQLEPRVAVLNGELVIDLNGDPRMAVAVDGRDAGCAVSTGSGVYIVGVHMTGRLQRCALAGEFTSSTEVVLSFGAWQLWLKRDDALGKLELLRLAAGSSS